MSPSNNKLPSLKNARKQVCACRNAQHRHHGKCHGDRLEILYKKDETEKENLHCCEQMNAALFHVLGVRGMGIFARLLKEEQKPTPKLNVG